MTYDIYTTMPDPGYATEFSSNCGLLPLTYISEYMERCKTLHNAIRDFVPINNSNVTNIKFAILDKLIRRGYEGRYWVFTVTTDDDEWKLDILKN